MLHLKLNWKVFHLKAGARTMCLWNVATGTVGAVLHQ